MPHPDNAQCYTYVRHRPEETPLYRIVETYYPEFLARLVAEGGSVPHFVQQQFDDYLKCGLLEHGFLRVKCETCSHEHLVAFSCKRRGFCPKCGGTRHVIACIENPDVIATILEHVGARDAAATAKPRAPPIDTAIPAARYQTRFL